MNDVVLDLTHHVGKQVAYARVLGDAIAYLKRTDKTDDGDEALERMEIGFTDGTRIVVSYWTSEMGGLSVDTK